MVVERPLSVCQYGGPEEGMKREQKRRQRYSRGRCLVQLAFQPKVWPQVEALGRG